MMATMFAKRPIADTASLLADDSRVAMLIALLDGQMRPAGDLARIANLSPQAASAHLAKLTEGQMLILVREGRHHYYRIAKPEVGIAIEALAVVNSLPKRATVKESEEVQALRFARTCYDHLAGYVAVQLVDALIRKDILRTNQKHFQVTPDGEIFLRSLEIDISAVRCSRRIFAKLCLDWTERKYHVAGSLGAALLAAFRAQGWIVSRSGTRAVRLTERGRQEFVQRLGVKL
jgi:DNA-binding transcriptional ArsR family regulator